MQLKTALNKLTTSHPVILTGDFNATSPLWSQQDTYNRAGMILEPLFLSLGLKQHVSEPTHLLHDHSPGNLLDLVLTNSPVKLSNLSLHSPIGKLDHLVVFFTVSLSIVRQTNKVMKRIWCYDKANISALNSELKEHDWSFVDSAESVDDAWDSWKSSFLEIISKHVPSKKLKRTAPKLPWITQHVLTEIKKKHSLFRVYKRTGLLTDRKAFVAQRNLVTRLLRKAERQYSTSLFRDRSTRSSSASNTFWSYVRSTMGKSQASSIPDLVNDAGATLRGDEQKACALNSFFTAQTNLKLKDSDPDLTDLPKHSKSFTSLYATSTEIYDIMRSLPRRKAPGPVTITTDLLRICAPGIASSLSVLINHSFRDAVFPSGWKLAYVTPVFKKGNPSLLTNYRPIALLSAVGKVCERLVYNKLYRFVTPVLSENQSGFRKKDGTAFQLTRLIQEWSHLLDDSHYFGVLFFDLRKAFDKVWHRGLLAKLKACGVTGAALDWFTSYLSNRQQCVKVNQSISSPLQIHAGVPQGAILSPLLFIIYMNDISQAAPKGSSVNLFADDTSLYVNDTCPRQLANELQHAADCVSSWFTRWLLTVNPEKTAMMLVRRKRMAPLSFQIFVNGKPVPQVLTHKHLGLIIEHTLSWTPQVISVCSRAAKKIGLLRRFRHWAKCSDTCTFESRFER